MKVELRMDMKIKIYVVTMLFLLIGGILYILLTKKIPEDNTKVIYMVVGGLIQMLAGQIGGMSKDIRKGDK